MKVHTTTARRKLVEGILAPQLHTLTHQGTGKLLKLVAIPTSPRGNRIREMYAEALFDLLESNNLLVVRRPEGAQVVDGGPVDVELDEGDLEPRPPAFDYRQVRRMQPGDGPEMAFTDHAGRPAPGERQGEKPLEGDLSDLAPSLVAKELPDDDPAAILGRGAAGMRPSDEARAAFMRQGARQRARDAISKIVVPLLRRMSCAVMVIDNADSTPEKIPTKVTMHIDLPRETVGV